jgi:WD40 repeat protein/energy-coupling factor transporter ATP-binding protein EcfA2
MSRDALVVGISSYQYLPALGTPAHDAEAIAHRLQVDGDFRVTRLPEIVQDGKTKVGIKTQVSLAELEAALVRLFKPKGRNVPHTALLYFSGHGLQKDAGIQEGYLATSDANPTACFYGLSLFWLRRLLQESPVRQRIILLDCCHSGELLNFLDGDPGARAGTDRLFMAASREYEFAYESLTGNYSVFTQAVLDGLDPHRTANGSVSNYALTNWVSTALKAEQQQPLFENSGSEILLTRCQAAPTVIQTQLVQEVCPYRGLECFDEAYAEYFFGREDLTDQLIEKLRVGNFMAVVGASGSGKSSLVRAGLIHKLRQGQKFSGSDRWRIQLITPTEQPLKSLATAFVNSKTATVDRAEYLRRAELLLREGEAGLSHLVRASLMSSKHGRNSRLLLIIDQFEEVFTLGQGTQAERDRHRFFTCLLNAMRECGDCLSVVIVLRADFFSKCSLYTGLAERIEQNLITVTPLTYKQIKDSILKPAEKVGLVCEPNLVYNILLDIVGSPGELPLLQYTLLELWQQRQHVENGAPCLTLDAYNELGGVRGSLQRRANEIFYSLTLEEQAVAKRIFIALTQLGEGTEDTRRRVLKAELLSPQFPAELVERVLERLIHAKLIVINQVMATSRHQEKIDQGLANVSTALRFAQRLRSKPSQKPLNWKPMQLISHLSNALRRRYNPGRMESSWGMASTCSPISTHGLTTHPETVDVVHEALIRNWELLRIWLDENREVLQWQRRIERVAREWDNADQPRSAEYLLRGSRLVDAEEFLHAHPAELSTLAQTYIAISQQDSHRCRKNLRLVQIAVPSMLLVALAVTFAQYRNAAHSQVEKAYQLQVATSRQQAAIAQTVLQEPDGDPTAALLISRLAAEQSERTNEAQASLRQALQKLRLQATLQGHEGGVSRVIFSPNQRDIATAGEDGTIRLWSMGTWVVKQIWCWQDEKPEIKATGEPVEQSTGKQTQSMASSFRQPPITSIAFSPDGKSLAAIAQGSTQVKLWSVESGQLQRTLEGSTQAMTRLAISPTGHWIAAVSTDHSVWIWNTETGQIQAQMTYPAAIVNLEFSPNGQWLLTTHRDTVQLWHMTTGRSRLLNHPATVNHATFSPDGTMIATASDNGDTRLWNVNTGQMRQLITAGDRVQQRHGGIAGGQNSVQRLFFSPDGQRLASVDRNDRVQLWKLPLGEQETELIDLNGLGEQQHPTQTTIAFSPDSQLMVTTNHPSAGDRGNYAVHLWSVPTGRMIGSLRGHLGAVQSVQFSWDGSLIATASADGTTRLWATDMGSEFPTFKLANSRISWATFWDQLVAVSSNGTIYHWSPLGRGAFSTPAAGASPAITLARQSPDQSLAARASRVLSRIGHAIAVWNPQPQHQENQSLAAASESGHSRTKTSRSSSDPDLVGTKQPGETADSNKAAMELSRQLPAGSMLTGVAFANKNRWIATATNDGHVDLWQILPNWTARHMLQFQSPSVGDRASGNSVDQTAEKESGILRYLALSPDNQTLLGVGENRTIYLWNVASGQLIQRLQGHGAGIETAQFSPNGQLIVSASQDRTARLWNVSSGKVVQQFSLAATGNSANFSPDGRLIVIASQDGTARIMDVVTGKLRVILTRHQGTMLNAEFSPDGLSLVTAGSDGTIRLWDANTGAEHVSLHPHGNRDELEAVQRAFFSPNGRYVATLTRNGQVHLWTATWDGLLDIARDRSLRQLKPDECLRYLRLPPNACPVLKMSVPS